MKNLSIVDLEHLGLWHLLVHHVSSKQLVSILKEIQAKILLNMSTNCNKWVKVLAVGGGNIIGYFGLEAYLGITDWKVLVAISNFDA